MARVITFGRMPDSIPKGNFREVRFPQLALLDQGTNEGWINRILHSDGADSRELPRTISLQWEDAPGHMFAVPGGSAWEVTVDGESGVLSGRGFLADTPAGHLTEIAAVSKSLHHNSIDLADIPPDGIQIEEHGDWWDDDFHVDLHFLKWSFGKTTLVAMPAFRNARMEVVGDDIEASFMRFAESMGWSPGEASEIRAGLGLDEPLVIDVPCTAEGHTSLEVAAGLTVEGLPKFDYFHHPESDIPHKVMLDEPDEHGWCHLYGNLARWGQPHTAITGRTVYARRSPDGYARFCQPSVLTDKGLVATGPITLYDGHRPLKACADDPATAWADVRVTDGRHGPWISGVARPHISHEMAERYVARASRLSGHWEYEGGPLRMIVSVNAEGFPIDHQPTGDEIAASFELDDDSMVPVMVPRELLSMSTLSDEGQQNVKAYLDALRAKGGTFTFNNLQFDSNGAQWELTTTEATDDDPTVDPDDEFDVDAAADERERELALEAEAGLLP